MSTLQCEAATVSEQNQTESIREFRPTVFISPVYPELLLVIRGPGLVLLLGGVVGLMYQHIHQLEVNGPVDLQVNCLLLILE